MDGERRDEAREERERMKKIALNIIYILYSRLAGAPCERERERGLRSPEKDSR